MPEPGGFDRGGTREDREDYLKMYQHLRTESDKYHDVMWKLAFATVVAAAAVSSFLLTHGTNGLVRMTPRTLFVLIGLLALAIGLTGTVLTHMYAVYREVTMQIGNVYRNGWLRAEKREVLITKLEERYALAVSVYKWNLVYTLRWTFPGVAVALAGAIVVIGGLAGCVPAGRT